ERLGVVGHLVGGGRLHLLENRAELARKRSDRLVGGWRVAFGLGSVLEHRLALDRAVAEDGQVSLRGGLGPRRGGPGGRVVAAVVAARAEEQGEGRQRHAQRSRPLVHHRGLPFSVVPVRTASPSTSTSMPGTAKPATST